MRRALTALNCAMDGAYVADGRRFTSEEQFVIDWLRKSLLSFKSVHRKVAVSAPRERIVGPVVKI